jgi:hypothetical protein
MSNVASLMRFSLATAAGLACLFAGPTNWSSPQDASVISQAEARIGRPLTPGSVAGVARRSTRRTVRRGVYYGAAAGAVGAGYYYNRGYGGYGYGGGCYRTTNRYGRLVTVCR